MAKNNPSYCQCGCGERAPTYHMLLHQRIRALKACGHANWRKCKYCKEWDAPKNLSIHKNTIYHIGCSREYYKLRYKRRLNVT